MEEKKEKTNVQETKKPAKLTYEQLEEAARQISQQAEAIFKENQQLKAALQQASVSNLYRELDFRFKVLENADMFSTKFLDMCIRNIEDTMTPKPEEKEEDGEEEEG